MKSSSKNLLIKSKLGNTKNHYFTPPNARQFYSSIGICEITQFHPNTVLNFDKLFQVCFI